MAKGTYIQPNCLQKPSMIRYILIVPRKKNRVSVSALGRKDLLRPLMLMLGVVNKVRHHTPPSPCHNY